jgi:hypothetical protein
LFNTLSLFPLELILNVLIGNLVDYGVKFLVKRGICKQAQLESLLARLVQLPEQIFFYLVFLVVNDVEVPPELPLLSMALDVHFVPAVIVNTFKYAFFKAYAQMMGSRPQRAF